MGRVSEGRKMMIYERFFRPELDYTIEEAYAFIEDYAPDRFDDESIERFQAAVNHRFRCADPARHPLH